MYDGDGKRTSTTVGATTINYVYDVGGGLPVLLTDTNRKYVWGGGGLAYETDIAGNVQAVSHADGLGSVRALTDGSGALTQTYRTDAFGVPTATQGSISQPFQFTGEQVDPTGLAYLRARIYDPPTGRFLQRDLSLGLRHNPATLNRFGYARNNPPLFIDPSGRAAVDQARALCAMQGWVCDDLTHDMAVELLNGNAVEIDIFDPMVLTTGSPIDKLIFIGVAAGTGGTSSVERTASTAFGRSVLNLKAFLTSGEGPWRMLAAHAEPARSVVYRGATSIEQVFHNPESGERIIRHIIVRADEILHETFRPFAKFGES